MNKITDKDILNAWEKFKQSGKVEDYIEYAKLNNFLER